MPELPEVETIRRGLSRAIVNKKISGIEVKKDTMVRGAARTFVRRLKGQRFSRISRRGKLLILHIAGHGAYLLVHLKMTGQLIYRQGKKQVAGGHPWPPLGEELPNKYSHIIFTFSDRSKLFFNDVRQFGYMQIVNDKELAKILDSYGPEPLQSNFSWPIFTARFRPKKTIVKAALLNQQVVAGIGNIYADEICWHAHVLPQRRVSSLSAAEIKALYRSIPKVLAQAVKHKGTTFSDYRDADGKQGNYVRLLKVYGRGGLKCKKCSAQISKIKVAGRGTHFCLRCQH